MVYRAWPYLWFAILDLFLIITVGFELTRGVVDPIKITVIVVFTLTIFLNFKLKLDTESITYEIYYFNLRVHQKVAYVDDIQEIRFKRVGWKQSSAKIILPGKFNIRVVSFKPKEVFKALAEYDVPKHKSEDYLVLEKFAGREG
ncbi:hypothetical protein [Alkalibacillus haloalkaliphilus]|uniref:PH domain-containing protein n=1 Tax=Alkalibacillus haloalkaliphilus TaxID=94136 RepID=A0A511W3A9_9BACI|nr:hypothetical protein [Alkalibacillus haloalkaliphilus]GEN45437.1 hypothetical protein AHA02nite_12130 [Alkalibacillus haloalkaliphilus]